MEQKNFDVLVNRLEQDAKRDPGSYMRKVLWVVALGFLVLGVAILFALFPLAALAALAFAVVITKGKALLIIFKLGKLLIILLIPSWLMLKSSLKILFSRFPKPQGYVLKPENAPILFQKIENLRQKTNGPQIHHILLTQELNAAIVQHPRFGLLGWEENYLIMGMSLLQILNESEAMAVVAHEYGHLSGQHGRLGGFIYRLRSTWARLQQMSEQWQDWGSRLISKLFAKYAPYFNAYTFVYARQNEYVADKASVELVGVNEAANALMRVQIAAQFEQHIFWPYLHKLASSQQEPIVNRSHYWVTAINTQLDELKRVQYLEQAKEIQTNNLDTHPSLSDRLNAIGVSPNAEHAKQLVASSQNAGQIWLGDHYQLILEEFDNVWRCDIAEQWKQRYDYVVARQQELNELHNKAVLSMDERWRCLVLEDELNSDVDITDKVEIFIADYPAHLHARYRHATLLLARGDEQGIEDLEFVMSKDADSIIPACEAAIDFYSGKNPEKVELYRQRWIERSEYLFEVKQEFSSLPANASLVAHDLDSEALSQIKALLEGSLKYVKKVYLLRRILKTDPGLFDYVLVFEASYWTFGDKSAEVLQRLSVLEFPFSAFIVNLKSASYKGFRKKVKHLGVLPIYEL